MHDSDLCRGLSWTEVWEQGLNGIIAKAGVPDRHTPEASSDRFAEGSARWIKAKRSGALRLTEAGASGSFRSIAATNLACCASARSAQPR